MHKEKVSYHMKKSNFAQTVRQTEWQKTTEKGSINVSATHNGDWKHLLQRLGDNKW